MTSITADKTTSNNPETASQIQSPIIRWLARIAFWLTLIGAILFSIQLISPSLSYYRSQADTYLPDANILGFIYVWGMFTVRYLIRLIFIGVAVFIYWRKPYDRMSIFTSLFLMSFGSGGIAYIQYVPEFTTYMAEHGLSWGWTILGSMGWIFLFIFPALFPDGRFVPKQIIYYLPLPILVTLTWALPHNSPLQPLNWPGILFVAIHSAALLIPLSSQVYRYRHVSTPVQRQQTKWILLGVSISILTLIIVSTLISFSSDTFTVGTISHLIAATIGDGGFITIPIMLSIAMLRYRLWDIDLLINRSMAYAVVAGVAILLFFAATVSLQLVIGQTQPIIALLFAAGFSAAIFNPLHRFVQKLVDRHIYHFRFQIDDLQRQHHLPTITERGALSGRTLSGYEVLDVIGKGGMGEVYKASNKGEIVAIKTLHLDKSDTEEFRRRFQREAEMGMTLDHPNIAKVYQINEADGLFYMVLEYIDGHDLHQYLKQESKLDIETVQTLAKQLADALDTAHAQGYVHRDIKPSNVMLRKNGAPVLMDFGIAKIRDAQTALTKTGAIGTIDYMAPEQIMEAQTVDHRADIYALSIMLYEMLAGERPFSGGAAQIMFAHIQQPPPDIRDIDDDMPRPIAKALQKSMAKNPDERFQTATEFSDALQA